jgi:hypothetical protein
MDTARLRFEVTKPKVAWGKVALDLALAGPNSGASDYNRGSSITVYNGRGDHRRLGRVPSEQEAQDKIAEMQRDMDLLSTRTWCEKYGVPVSFVTE